MADLDEASRLNPDLAAAYNIGARLSGIWGSTTGPSRTTMRPYAEPRFRRPHTNRGIVYGKIGDHDRAVVDHDAAIRLNPGLAVAYNNRGSAYDKLERYQQAIEDYDAASDSTRITPLPTSTGATPTAASERTNGPSATTMRPSGSTPVSPGPTTTGDWRMPPSRYDQPYGTMTRPSASTRLRQSP